MTPTYKETVLADILAALLRIEAKMDAAKVADTATDTVKFYQRLLEKQAKERAPDHTRWVPPLVPNMPEPPIAPVRPQTVWQRDGVYTGNSVKADKPQHQWRTPPAGYAHGGWTHATGFSMVGP